MRDNLETPGAMYFLAKDGIKEQSGSVKDDSKLLSNVSVTHGALKDT